MSSENRLSAIAKRRRANGNVSVSAESTRSNSRTQSPVRSTEVKRTKIVELTQSNAVKSSTGDNSNTFSALVARDVVQFSNFRSIDRLNEHSIRVRLSKGQKCVVAGRYTLWIKEGKLELLGAKLEASVVVHTVNTLPSPDIPVICALTKTTEFEISSQRDQIPVFLGPDLFSWISPSGGDQFHVSFVVHGYSTSLDGAPVQQGKEFVNSTTTDLLPSTIRSLSNGEDVVTSPILLCGKPFNGSALPFLHIINSILTVSKLKRSLILLDLDSTNPTFVPSGVTSILHISQPILGTACIRPYVDDVDNKTETVRIIRMDHSPRSEDVRGSIQMLQHCLDYMRILQKDTFRGSTLLIKATEWMESLDMDNVPDIMDAILPGLVICHGADSSSVSGQVGYAIEERSQQCQILNLPTISLVGLSTTTLNQLGVQRYFHVWDDPFGRPKWSSLPLEIDRNHRVWLQWGEDSAFVNSVTFQTKLFAQEDLLEILEGCMVAMILQATNNETGAEEISSSVKSEPWGTINSAWHARHPTGGNCVGFGIVADLTPDKICLLTPVPGRVFERLERQRNKIHLIAYPADPDSGFDTRWVQLELGVLIPEGRSGKAVYRRKLNTQ